MSTQRGILLLLLITAGIFSPLLVADFLWDDQILVIENLWTHNLANLPLFFTSSLWEATPIAETTTPYYRPMMSVELMLDRQLFGLSPVAHHAHSLAWHLVCTLLVWRFIRGMGGQGLAALASTALFALHPFQTEIVAFIAARNDAMALAGILGALILLEEKAPSRTRLLQAAACALYALLSKETALVLPLMLVFCDLLRHGTVVGITRYGALGISISAFILIRSLVSIEPPELELLTMMKTAPEVSASYVTRLLWPVGTSPTTPLGVLPISFLLLGMAGVLTGLSLWAGGRMAAVGLGLFMVAFTPALAGVVLYGGLPYRYAYLPLLGIALAYCSCWQTRPQHPACLLIPLLLAGLTSTQLTDWSTNQTLWEKGYRVAPGVDTACGLFKAYEAQINQAVESDPQRASLMAKAESILEEALGPPPSQYCCYSASRWYWNQGRIENARTSGLQALENGCEQSPELLAPLAMSEAVSGLWDAAESHATLAGKDPTGLAPVVLAAAAMRRGDESVLREWEQKMSPDSQMSLRDQVDFVLSQSPPTPPSNLASPTVESGQP